MHDTKSIMNDVFRLLDRLAVNWAVIRMPSTGHSVIFSEDIDIWCDLNAIRLIWINIQRLGWVFESGRGISYNPTSVISALLRFSYSKGTDNKLFIDFHFGALRWSIFQYFNAPIAICDIDRNTHMPLLTGAALFASQANRCVLRGNLEGKRLKIARNIWNGLSFVDRCRWADQTTHLLSSWTVKSILNAVNSEENSLSTGLARLFVFIRQYCFFKGHRHNLTRWLLLKLRQKHHSQNNTLCISFIGTDGSGKSTLISRLAVKMREAGEAIQIAYWGRSRGQIRLVENIRRMLLKSSTKIVSNGSKCHHSAISGSIGAFVYCVDYWIRWFVHVQPALRRGKTVILDRGPADIKVMYSAAPWVRQLWRLAPMPDLVIYTYARAECIAARKHERSLTEIKKHLVDYAGVVENLVEQEHPVYCSNTEKPLSVSLNGILQAIDLARNCRRGKLDPALFFPLAYPNSRWSSYEN